MPSPIEGEDREYDADDDEDREDSFNGDRHAKMQKREPSASLSSTSSSSSTSSYSSTAPSVPSTLKLIEDGEGDTSSDSHVSGTSNAYEFGGLSPRKSLSPLCGTHRPANDSQPMTKSVSRTLTFNEAPEGTRDKRSSASSSSSSSSSSVLSSSSSLAATLSAPLATNCRLPIKDYVDEGGDEGDDEVGDEQRTPVKGSLLREEATPNMKKEPVQSIHGATFQPNRGWWGNETRQVTPKEQRGQKRKRNAGEQGTAKSGNRREVGTATGKIRKNRSGEARKGKAPPKNKTKTGNRIAARRSRAKKRQKQIEDEQTLALLRQRWAEAGGDDMLVDNTEKCVAPTKNIKKKNTRTNGEGDAKQQVKINNAAASARYRAKSKKLIDHTTREISRLTHLLRDKNCR
jgi:hypothetical protein